MKKRTSSLILLASLFLAQIPVLAEGPTDTSSQEETSSSSTSTEESSSSSTSQDSSSSSSSESQPSSSAKEEETKPKSEVDSAPAEPLSPKEKEDAAGIKKEDDEKDQDGGNFTVSVNHTTQSFIKLIAEDARTIGKEYKLYASVMIAQAILESGSGNSGLAQAPNYNLFGIKGAYEGSSVSMDTKEDDGSGKLHTVKAAFRKYPNVRASLTDYAKLLRTELYRGAWIENAATYQAATKALTGRYATDIHYDKKLNALIEAYDLTQYDKDTDKTLLERYPDGDYPDYDGKDYPGVENYKETSARYAFNRMSQLGGKLETNFAETTNWADSASKQGYTVNQEPKIGTVVAFQPKQEKAGSQGQVAIVEKLYPSGAILISEYGKFSEKLVSYRVIDSQAAKTLHYITPKSSKN
ncbi:glucosaminidase domain-containing protein [Streptococcus oricebi]|uniref:Peptidase C51 domain-containing protein n=1 Tax=Streptococcus oricebi TaxID=1547447 RepID=A0ABS5B280_9STRE|nr:glucosaminidase domain-containing protein [Streptococcus oricebi]MBP2622932.1 hypothetical protein [Streptococcus oricebi]